MIKRDKVFGNNQLINIIKLIFYPIFKLRLEIAELTANPQESVVSLLFIVFISGMMSLSIIYCAITPSYSNFLNPILNVLPITNQIARTLYSFYLTTSIASYIGCYLGNISSKLYCYLTTGHPDIYLNQYRLQTITSTLKNKGYHNIDKEVSLEIIKFCINKTKGNRSNILGNDTIDWECTLEHLLKSDLNYFLEQQYILRNQRKKYIRKIISFYMYHRDCHKKSKANILSPRNTRKDSNTASVQESTRSRSSVENSLTNTFELNKEFFENNDIFNEKILLFSNLEHKIVISNKSIEATKKDYQLFKQNHIKINPLENITPYQEYLLLDKYEQFLYQTAAEISSSIFPEEIITLMDLDDDYLQIQNSQHNSDNLVESFIYSATVLNNYSDLSGLGSRQSTFVANEPQTISLKLE